jgi:hypothetical protein
MNWREISVTRSKWLIRDIQTHPIAPNLYTIAIHRTSTIPVQGKAYQVQEVPEAVIEIIGEELIHPPQQEVMRIGLYITGISHSEATKLKGCIITAKAEVQHNGDS